METGHRGATPRDVRDLCQLYGVTETGRARPLDDLGERRQAARLVAVLRPAYSTYVGLEAAAIWAKGFHSSVVPGLLQTADYARASTRGDA